MRKELKKKLEPLVDYFVSKMMQEYSSIEQVRKSAEKEIVNLKSQQDFLREQEKENAKRHDVIKARLLEQDTESKKKVGELNMEIGRYNKLTKDLDKMRADTEKNLATSKSEKELISNELKRTREKKEEYEIKINALEKDYQILSAKEKDLNERENKLNARERLLDKKAMEFAGKEHELSIKALDLKAEQKRIDFEIKKLKAK